MIDNGEAYPEGLEHGQVGNGGRKGKGGGRIL